MENPPLPSCCEGERAVGGETEPGIRSRGSQPGCVPSALKPTAALLSLLGQTLALITQAGSCRRSGSVGKGEFPDP